MTIHDMQNLNRNAVAYVTSVIQPGMTLSSVRSLCEEYLLTHGADSFWYWDVGAFIFRNEDTTRSVSGRDYRIADTVIESTDIITIDLSPQYENIWGDYARTIVIENGVAITDPTKIRNDEWRSGLLMEESLHKAMRAFVCRDTTFEQLFFYINNVIRDNGYLNLDFLGNLGHSIVREKGQRIYIEKGNHTKLSEVEAFTFEPHISLLGGKYGYKMENIYAFEDEHLIEL